MKNFIYEAHFSDSELKKVGKSQGDVFEKRKVAENYFFQQSMREFMLAYQK